MGGDFGSSWVGGWLVDIEGEGGWMGRLYLLFRYVSFLQDDLPLPWRQLALVVTHGP